MQKSRRTFIKKSALAGAAFAIQPFPIFASGSPNEKVVLAVMGVRSRGLDLAKTFAQRANAEIAVVCDVDKRYLDKCVEEVAKLQKRKPKDEKDIRKVLENKDIDAVVIAAPDHWHAPAAIMAVKAGKHVYLEKPCSHNPAEGEMLIEAEKKYKRIIQMGNQRRSWPNVVEAVNDLRSGIIGKVYYAKGWYANNRKSIGFGKEAPVPDYLDFDLWQGPAPRTPYRDNIHPYEWHWFWRWGTGEALNNGTHEIDVMRWGMGVDFPSRVVAAGGRYHFNDDWEFPDTMVANFDFEDGRTITWESRSCNPYILHGDGRGVIFHGEKGTLLQTQHDYVVYDMDNKVIKEVKHQSETAIDGTNTVSPFAAMEYAHADNFLDGIRLGKPVSSPIAEGHKSVLMCQLSNIAWRTGRALNIDQRNGHIIGDREAMSYWGRDYEPGWEPVV
jgi:predicted dehydrogenase